MNDELTDLRQAVGLMTTIKGDMVMRVDDPIGMAQEVAAYIAALRADLAAAIAAKEEAERRLCRIRKATDETKGHVDNLWHKIDIILSSSSPCPHAAEADALREAIRWAHAPVNVFAFDPGAREQFLAELDKRAALRG